MISGIDLWLAMVGLYLVESLRVTTVSATVFRRNFFSNGWHAESPIAFPQRTRWAWTARSLLPFREPALVCQNLLVAYDSEGIAPNHAFAWSRGSATRYSEIRSISEEDRWLSINGAQFVRLESRSHAEFERDRILRIKGLACEQRETGIRSEIAAALSKKLLPELEQLVECTRWLRSLAAAQWFTGFVLLPTLVLTGRSDATLVISLTLFWVFGIVTALVYSGVERRTYPSRGGFCWKSLLFAVYPIAALRAFDHLADSICSGAHPLAVCVELCHRDVAETAARNIYLRSLYPVPMAEVSVDSLESSESISQGFNKITADIMRRFLQNSLPAALLGLVPPQRWAASRSYCPRCLAEFVADGGQCPDCPNIPLRSFSAGGNGR